MSQQRDELLTEFEVLVPIMLAGMLARIIKQTSKRGEAGEIPCPVCHAGVLRWSRARSNGHVAIACDRTYLGDDGKERRCVAAME